MLQGCSSATVEKADPAAVYQEAEDDIKNDHFILATEKLRTIRNKFPYSQFAPLAQLRLGDVHFLQESYAEAATSYETFRDLYPKHERAAYALFRIGKSYFLEAPTNIARDLTSAQRALESYRSFIKKYPTAEQLSEAQTDAASIELLLAKKEKYIADFYQRQGQPKAAKTRLQKIVSLYPNTAVAADAKKLLEQPGESP
jgi:outer membrane protein assembly factor BamD